MKQTKLFLVLTLTALVILSCYSDNNPSKVTDPTQTGSGATGYGVDFTAYPAMSEADTLAVLGISTSTEIKLTGSGLSHGLAVPDDGSTTLNTTSINQVPFAIANPAKGKTDAQSDSILFTIEVKAKFNLGSHTNDSAILYWGSAASKIALNIDDETLRVNNNVSANYLSGTSTVTKSADHDFVFSFTKTDRDSGTVTVTLDGATVVNAVNTDTVSDVQTAITAILLNTNPTFILLFKLVGNSDTEQPVLKSLSFVKK